MCWNGMSDALLVCKVHYVSRMYSLIGSIVQLNL